MDEKIRELRQNSDKAQCFFSKQLAFTLGPVELKNFMEKGSIKIIDVRTSQDYEAGHIPMAVSIPKDELEKNLNKLSKNEITIVYCYNEQCHLGYSACMKLAELGYPVMHLDGGFKVWSEDFRFAVVN